MTTLPSAPIEVSHTRIHCDGGGGASGHPKIYLEMGKGAEIVCPYCGQVFIQADKSSAPMQTGVTA